MKSQGFSGAQRRRSNQTTPRNITPASLDELVGQLGAGGNLATPIRPRGSGSSITDCGATGIGTTIDTIGLNRIISINTADMTVITEAGVRLCDLVVELAKEGLELIGNFSELDRTVGGAISAPCLGPGIGNQAAMLSTQVVSLKAVLADGRLLEVQDTQKRMLRALRVSYGMLGVIYEVTLKVRPVMTFTAWHRAMDIETFARFTEQMPGGNVGLKFFLMPYRNRAYLDLRHYDRKTRGDVPPASSRRGWGDSTAISGVYRSISRFVPFAAIRYPLADTLSATTHGLMNARKVALGNNVTGRRRNGHESRRFLYSTWCFPASDFSLVAQAYARFCRGAFARTAYRCDMPAVGYRIGKDQSALLSPSYDEPMIALQTLSTVRRGWDNFVLELADFAEHWAGIPIFNQTISTRPAYVPLTYGGRIEYFRDIRRQLDPQSRFLNPYLARHYQ